MEKRTSERIHVNIEMKFICCNKVYSGKMTNVSKSGMFVQVDEVCYPFNSQLEMVIPFKGDELHVPVDLNRIVMSPDSHDGIGVELTSPSSEYLDFINSYTANALLKSRHND